MRGAETGDSATRKSMCSLRPLRRPAAAIVSRSAGALWRRVWIPQRAISSSPPMAGESSSPASHGARLLGLRALRAQRLSRELQRLHGLPPALILWGERTANTCSLFWSLHHNRWRLSARGDRHKGVAELARVVCSRWAGELGSPRRLPIMSFGWLGLGLVTIRPDQPWFVRRRGLRLAALNARAAADVVARHGAADRHVDSPGDADRRGRHGVILVPGGCWGAHAGVA